MNEPGRFRGRRTWTGRTLLGVSLVLILDRCSSPANPLLNCLSRAVFGDPAQSSYTLPYPVGSSYPVLQAYCTSESHANQLAYDFQMPIGAPVVSAREGVVVEFVDAYEDTDCDSRHFNYVMIEHSDGTTAFYAHVRHGSILVGLNEEVGRGQPIAQSGSAGTPVPDLHFGVYQTWPVHDGDDIAVNFRNAQGPLDARGGLQQGVAYLALPY